MHSFIYLFLCIFYLDPVPLNPGEPQSVAAFIGEHKKRSDADPNAPPFDDLRNYAYEGGGSTAGSLSSLASGNKYKYIYVNFFGSKPSINPHKYIQKVLSKLD